MESRMKVLLVNGSPHEKRCTFTALEEAAKALAAQGIESEIEWIGKEPIRGCQACGTCRKTSKKRCIYNDDIVNSLLDKAESTDGFIFGTPTYYAGANGSLISLLDRMFYAGSSLMAFKPAAAVAVARRAGTIPALDQVTKYFLINQMPVVSSNYWPIVFGNSVDEAKQDEEGLQIMRVLGQNMAWMLNCIEVASKNGVTLPQPENKLYTNFIRPL